MLEYILFYYLIKGAYISCSCSYHAYQAFWCLFFKHQHWKSVSKFQLVWILFLLPACFGFLSYMYFSYWPHYKVHSTLIQLISWEVPAHKNISKLSTCLYPPSRQTVPANKSICMSPVILSTLSTLPLLYNNYA